ncbi:LysR family transcriptional regulator [Amycolatopsis alkalitolerans]|uniref:LysR family transcriptional regulator n=1 Tax=Amycolatopsis alkalitolerans TaxID=2547244 RepID=A0A5C4M2K5_9PSEU|nr:LysR family transcriptional regulator [Amycolatopsis alkalitolerans]TNC25842.1 LysR family transcriptional regulator [Amycolatopsis alkalitolerans]
MPALHPDGHREAEEVPAPQLRPPFARLSSRVPEIGALELFLSVARFGSLGQAAREHGISQPAAGSRIRNLERVLGLALIERSAAGSRLTPEGAMVEQWAREVVRAAAGLDAAAAALRAQHERRLRIAASMTVAEYLIPGWLTELHARRPRATVALQVTNSTEVARLVASDAADIGFIEGPEMPEGLQCQVVGHDRLRLVVAPGHPWARRRHPVGAADVATTALVAREPGSGTRETVEAVLAEHGPLAGPLVELSSTTAIKAAVEAGVGPAILSSLAVAAELADGRLVGVEMAGMELNRVLRAVWPAGRRLTGVLRDVVAVARSGGRQPGRVQSSA